MVRAITWLFCILPAFALAQQDTTTLKRKHRYTFFSPATEFKKGFIVQLDNRSSFIRNAPVNIYGLALEYNATKNTQRGIGFFMINKANYQNKKKALKEKPIPDLLLFYATPNYTYNLLHNRWFEVGIPLELGFGYATFVIADPRTQRNVAGHQWFVPAEGGISGLFKLNRWLGFKASVGYRKIIWETRETPAVKGAPQEKGKINLDFDGMYYAYGAKIFFGTIIQDIRDHRRREKLKF